jgi:hypothetical protein
VCVVWLRQVRAGHDVVTKRVTPFWREHGVEVRALGARARAPRTDTSMVQLLHARADYVYVQVFEIATQRMRHAFDIVRDMDLTGAAVLARGFVARHNAMRQLSQDLTRSSCARGMDPCMMFSRFVARPPEE